MTEQKSQHWYIVKRKSEKCEVVTSQKLQSDNSEVIEEWGPFDSEGEAIARRVGLIRAGKCQPV